MCLYEVLYKVTWMDKAHWLRVSKTKAKVISVI